jgi:CheY-like chemotaxis protein
VEKIFILHLLLKDELEGEGYKVLSAQCCEEAIEIIQKTKGIDLIITSIEFPRRMSGTDFVEWLNANVPEIPVIILSATDVADGYPVTANLARECIAKSPDLRPLLDAVRRQTRSISDS